MKKLKIAMFFALVALCMPMTAIGAENVIYAGVTIGGVDVSGMSREAATSKVNEAVEAAQNAEITIHCIEDGTVVLPISDIDLKWTNTKVVSEALTYGNAGNFIRRYKDKKDISKHGAEYRIEYSVSTDAIDKFVEEKCLVFNREAKEAALEKTSNGFSVVPGHTGIVIDKEEAVAFITNFLLNEWDGNSCEITLPSKIDNLKANAEDLGKVTELLATASTSYKTSGADRSANVANGCRLINGTTLYPGEEFSTYESIKPFSVDNGYKMAGSYLNGMVVDSLGGGICQVSTTLYNAVLKAELEVTERHNHSMIVSYVPASSDAAIAESSGKDFKFVNNTEYPIYIEGYTTDEKKIVFNIYGYESRPANRTVEYVSEVLETIPALTENIIPSASYPVGYISVQSAHTGYKSRLIKVVKVDGVEESREVVNSSNYKMVPRTAVVGIATADPTAAAQISEAIATGSIDYCRSVAGAWVASALAVAPPAGADANP